ncbi:tRNA (guanine-N(7)-)-methyltransferase [Malonomonas rubra DSM 5091]|uniref:tRNA (guanine-N(7)-)-methyltransferase n=1 Tax=Malonomonas rubra DSM 5091 TaxID=1122189 RepID=A0A1M6IAF4_MALRU|nr:tRNA (guanosine(46)-N7)-methyltransferase TrmB [Malonomonas rubra]SHJ31387.1 tRNA (guanine-N(7)-)-methyltransferase [Malonomonas rubra DSM 5091]
MSQRMTLITSPVFIPEAQLKKADGFAALFGNDKPLCLEIGCGIGDFVVQIAARQPEYNFIAIDIFNQGCRATCTRIEESGLDNIRMMRMEARYLLHHHLGKDSLQAIYINCPDPWPKKRHRKRRLLNKSFLDLVLYCLQPGGILNFSTDFVDYGEATGELLAADERFENLHSTAYTHELGDYPISKYMRRFLDLGQPIYLCRYRKKEGVVIPAPKIQKGFRLRWAKEDE